MITVSEKMKAYLKRTGRSFHGKIEVGDSVVYDGIMSVFIDRSVCTDELTLGNVNCAFAEISLYDCKVSLKGQEIKAYIAAEIDGKDEWIKLGTFTAEKPETDDKLTSFKAYDSVKYKTDGTYFPSESITGEETAADAVFADICQQCGVPFIPLFPDGTAESEKPKVDPKKISGQTLKKALGLLAGFMGGNLICNTDGKFEVKKFTECDFTIDEGSYSVATISETDFEVGKIICNTGDTILTSGTDSGKVFEFENCLMTQERLDSIFAEIGGLSYRAISAENLVGNPCIEPGDIITLSKDGVEYKLPVMHVTVDFDGGIMNIFEAFSKTEEEKAGSLEDIREAVGSVSKESSEFAEAFNAALGLYLSKQTLSDGSTKYYYHNNPTLADSTYIFTRNAGGFAFVTGENCWNGGSPNWQYGVTSDGNAILNYLVLNKLTADYIDVDSLFAKDITADNSIHSADTYMLGGDEYYGTWFRLKNRTLTFVDKLGNGTHAVMSLQPGFLYFANFSEDGENILSSTFLSSDPKATRKNIGAVGNVVRQRHTFCSGQQIAIGEAYSADVTFTKSGYKPVGIVGQHHSGSWATYAMIQNLYISSASDGSATVSGRIRNLSTQAAIGATSPYSLEIDILWVEI